MGHGKVLGMWKKKKKGLRDTPHIFGSGRLNHLMAVCMVCYKSINGTLFVPVLSSSNLWELEVKGFASNLVAQLALSSVSNGNINVQILQSQI